MPAVAMLVAVGDQLPASTAGASAQHDAELFRGAGYCFEGCYEGRQSFQLPGALIEVPPPPRTTQDPPADPPNNDSPTSAAPTSTPPALVFDVPSPRDPIASASAPELDRQPDAPSDSGSDFYAPYDDVPHSLEVSFEVHPEWWLLDPEYVRDPDNGEDVLVYPERVLIIRYDETDIGLLTDSKFVVGAAITLYDLSSIGIRDEKGRIIGFPPGALERSPPIGDEYYDGRAQGFPTPEDFAKFVAEQVAMLLLAEGAGLVVGRAVQGVAAAGRNIRMARWPNWSFGNTGKALGTTDKFGRITIQRGLTGRELVETLRHESVHSVLSPRPGGVLQTARADARMWAYKNSNLVRYLEEALAETYATGSLRTGMSFPLKYYNISTVGLAVEATAYGAVVVGPGAYVVITTDKQ